MAIYSLAVSSSINTSGAASFELRTTTHDRIQLMECYIDTNSAPAGVLTVGLGTPAAIGIGPTVQKSAVEDTGQRPGTTFVATNWQTGPTSPVNFFRRSNIDTNAGVPLVWQFPKGLSVTSMSSLVIWNITASTGLDAYFVWDE